MTTQDSTAQAQGDGYDQPHDVSNVMMVFPGNLGDLLPEWDVIPPEFRDDTQTSLPWRRFQAKWFFGGISRSALTPRDDVDPTRALRHLKAIQGSFEPKHEHKEAAVAWLASRWFAAVDLSAVK